MRSVVLIHGLLRGMGHEGACEMLAIRESQTGGGSPVYSRCSVIDAPAGLPDGDYTVAFDGLLVPTKKESGLWVPDGATSPAALAPVESREQRDLPFPADETAEIFPVLKDRVA